MIPVGGYFELELRKGVEYHDRAIQLNTGRNALELILRTRKYSKVYIPYFTCDTILEPFNKLGIDYEYYSINHEFEPVFDYKIIQADHGFLYTNYFGLKDSFINIIAKKVKNLIIDNAQSFFSSPLKKVDTFYSVRKFFGVSDGAYLYLNGIDKIDLPLDHSESRVTHLLKRIEYGAEKGYKYFKANDNNLIGQSIKRMSNLTQALLCNIDYNFVIQKRRENFLILNQKLSQYNELLFKLKTKSIPMIYPLLYNKPGIKQKLIEQKIFTPTYWPNVLKWTLEKSLEFKLTKEIIYLPIDQRYGIYEMENIIKIITESY